MLIVAAAALIRNDTHVLIQQCPPGHLHAGLWEFPGGKVEAGEVPRTALARELAEELGITSHPDDFTPVAFAEGAGRAGPLLLMLYRCARWSGEPQPLHASALEWVSAAELASAPTNYPMAPADVPLAAALARLLPA